jgi:hypothetical protein
MLLPFLQSKCHAFLSLLMGKCICFYILVDNKLLDDDGARTH